nr:LysR family transcriptional regulator [Microbacterium pseudoresistens]
MLTATVVCGSISAAARELGITQQSASARLRSIERRFGLELFHRTPAGVRTTPAGEAVASWAEEVLVAAEHFRVGVETLRDEQRRQLVVAASQTVSAHLLPAWLVALRARQVEAGIAPTAVRMLSGNSADVEAAVRAGDADLGFVESSVVAPDFSRSVVAQDALVVVVGVQHAWARRARVSPGEVADAALVMREEGSGTRRSWEQTARERLGRSPADPVAVLPTSAAVRSAVAEGVGPAVLSRRAVADDVHLGRLREIPWADEAVLRPITAVWRGTARDLSPVSRRLIEIAAQASRVEAARYRRRADGPHPRD